MALPLRYTKMNWTAKIAKYLTKKMDVLCEPKELICLRPGSNSLLFHEAKILFASWKKHPMPGWSGTSGLEKSQNSLRI